jgi:L-alanine-DL-glutamate epimerase-like enolase superfamily enzyme
MKTTKPFSQLNRRNFLKRSAAVTAGGVLSAGAFAQPAANLSSKSDVYSNIKITDLKCAIIGQSPIVRITTNQGISGYGEAERAKSYLKPYVLFYRDYLLNEDPTDVEHVMRKIRRLGGFKPWGSAVSAIEMALWDIAGKAAGIPVYKLLGGKVRSKVMVYNGGVRFQMEGVEPEHYADNMAKIMEVQEKFKIIKVGVGFHSKMPYLVDDFFYGEPIAGKSPGTTLEKGQYTKPAPHPNRGSLTAKGLDHIIRCTEAMSKVLGNEARLALDIGPGHTVPDAIRMAKAMEPFNLMWLEDLLTGDYYPYVMADVYKEVTQSTITPIHTGEQIYLRQNFRELIEQKAVRVIGPDPADMGGIAEMKWVGEYADLHGILIAPHGIFNGLIGIAAHVQAGCTMPDNYIAFEYPRASPRWWYDIIDGLPDPIVENGYINVWDAPGLGVEFNIKEAKKHLTEEDKHFFD